MSEHSLCKRAWASVQISYGLRYEYSIRNRGRHVLSSRILRGDMISNYQLSTFALSSQGRRFSVDWLYHDKNWTTIRVSKESAKQLINFTIIFQNWTILQSSFYAVTHNCPREHSDSYARLPLSWMREAAMGLSRKEFLSCRCFDCCGPLGYKSQPFIHIFFLLPHPLASLFPRAFRHLLLHRSIMIPQAPSIDEPYSSLSAPHVES